MCSKERRRRETRRGIWQCVRVQRKEPVGGRMERRKNKVKGQERGKNGKSDLNYLVKAKSN